MEIKKQELNPDDLDQIFRGVQQIIESKDNDFQTLLPQLRCKYKNYTFSEADRKLLLRFFFRICELQDKSRNSMIMQLISNLKELISQNQINFTVILTRLHNILNKQGELQELTIFPRRAVPQWQIHQQNNRPLFEFYELAFWKLYDILNLNKPYQSSLIVLHQSKQENLERLLQLSLERNQRLHQNGQTLQLDDIEQRALILQEERINYKFETPYSKQSKKNLTMFGGSPQRRHTPMRAITVSPSRGISTNGIQDIDTQDVRTRNKTFSLHQQELKNAINDQNMLFQIDNQTKSNFRHKLQQENNNNINNNNINNSPVKQNWMLPEINNDQQLIRPIQIHRESPDKRSRHSRFGIQPSPNSIYSQLQNRTQTRAFQTIKVVIRK